MYRYAELWVDEVSASYAALGSVFLGSLAMLVYQSGQLPTTAAAALTLNAIPFFYVWLRTGADLRALLKAVGDCLGGCGGSPRHTVFRRSVICHSGTGVRDYGSRCGGRRGETTPRWRRSRRGQSFSRVIAIAGVAVVLYPYWIALLKNPINQMPIPHGSRDNYLLQPFSGINFWIIPMGALILAIPFIIDARLGGPAAASVAVRLVCDRAARLGRNDPCGPHTARPCVQGTHLRTVHFLGHCSWRCRSWVCLP